METDKAKLRQKILAAESDINTLSGFAASGKLQFASQGLPAHMQLPPNGYPNGGHNSQHYDNHELLTPVNVPGAYPGTSQGRASMTSTSSRSMQRFFRRKGGDNGAFDEENGADISDVAADMSFADIAHIRGNGRYNTSATQALDTLPIIPVLGPGSSSGNPKNLNNIQYRKYMNQQKKQNLANSARAMSLAGNNPAYLMTSDPRSMSFGTPQDGGTNSYGPQNGRAQSLGGQMNQVPNGPRAMSLNSNVMLRGQGPVRRGPNMNMNPNMSPNMGNNMSPSMGNMNPNMGNMNPMYNQMNMNTGGPRAQSLRTGNPYQQFRGPPNNRNNSMGGFSGGVPSPMAGMAPGPMPAPMGQFGNQGYAPMGQRTSSLTQGGAYPPLQKKMGGRPLTQQPYGTSEQYYEYQSQFDNLNLRPPQQGSNSNSNTNSQDSFMNVVEEEKEDLNLNDEDPQLDFTDKSLPLAETTFNEENDDDAHEDFVYRFEGDHNSPQVSRKSTVKKSNSMRVRRLDLFKPSAPATAEEPTVEAELSEFSFNLQRVGDRLSKKLVEENDEEATKHIASQAAKLSTLGATNKEKDVFTTASEFRPTRKKPPPPEDIEEPKMEKVEKTGPENSTEGSAPPSPNILMLSQPQSRARRDYYQLPEGQVSRDSVDSKKRPIRLRSLVANTAFSNFRTTSLGSQSMESHSEKQPHAEKSFREFEEHQPPFDHPNNSSDELENSRAQGDSGQIQDELSRKHIRKNSKQSDAGVDGESKGHGKSHPENAIKSFAPPQTERSHSETESQSSVDSTETPKQHATDALVSTSSEQHSHSSETKRKLGMSEDDLNAFEFNERPSARRASGSEYQVNNKEHEDQRVPRAEGLQGHNPQSEYTDGVSHTESSRATSETKVSGKALGIATEDSLTPLVQKRTSAISRSNSELKVQGLLPSSSLLKGTDTEGYHAPGVDLQDAKRKSRTSSISTRSMSFIKRMSRSGSKKSLAEELSFNEPSTSYGLRVISSASAKELRKPLVFTKEELAIMTCNNDLQNELQMVTSELAMSIKRELLLERQMRNGQHKSDPSDGHNYEEEATERAAIISELLEKLNNERRLRFISEEHAILSEHGQAPSALKLDYEKNEIYKQLLAKNDLVNQLQDRLEELENQDTESGRGLLHKYNDLLRENSELRSKLETVQASSEQQSPYGTSFSLDENTNEYEQAQIISLRTQRDELREMLTKLTSSQNMELKIAQDRIKTLEDKLQKVNMINDKLSRRLDRGGEISKGNDYSRETSFSSGQGGRLLGFDIVSPRKMFHDE